MIKSLLTILFLGITSALFSQTISDCEICDKILLKESHIKSKSLEELALLRNEILARNGYNFSNEMYSSYFENQDWYTAIQDNEKLELSAIEIKNIDFLKKFEFNELTKRKKALSNLIELKNALNIKDELILKKYLSRLQQAQHEYYQSLVAELDEAMNKLDLNNINWNKNAGLYKVTIDNGYYISIYEIRFSYNKVLIMNSEISSNSEIFGEFHDGYSDYMSENESSTWWEFKLTMDGIIYEAVHIAG